MSGWVIFLLIVCGYCLIGIDLVDNMAFEIHGAFISFGRAGG